MPEEFLKSIFDIEKAKVGTPVLVRIYRREPFQCRVSEHIEYGHIINVQPGYIEIGAFDEENQPTVCKITAEQLLEEVVTIEKL